MIRPQLVFIFPLRRCGSNFLRLHLDLHPSIYAPYPIHIHEFMHLLPKYGNLDHDPNYFRLISDVIGFQNTTLMRWTHISFDPLSLFNCLEFKPRSIHRIVGEMYLQAAEKCGAKVVIDKSQDSIFYADDIIKQYPDALIIDLVRDPRAQINSMNQAIIHDFDTLLNLNTWLERRELMKKLAQKIPQNVLCIKYEDFILDTQNVLQKVCTFLKVDYDENMINIKNSQEAFRMSSISSLWKNNCYPPLQTNINKFSTQMSVQDIQMIEWKSQNYIQELGYQFYYPLKEYYITESLVQSCKEQNKILLANLSDKIKEDNIKDYTIRNCRKKYLDSLK